MAEEEKKLNIPNLQILGQDDSPLFQGAGSEGKSVTYPKKFANHPGFKRSIADCLADMEKYVFPEVNKD